MKNFKTIKFQGIGTHWWVDIDAVTSDKTLSKIELELLKTLKEFEENYSRFKDSSFVGQLNLQKQIKNFPHELFEMVKLAEEIRQLTDNYFNVCVGTHLENLGYDKKYSFQEKDSETSTQLGIKILSKDLIEITQSTRIDLGGLGKGWLIEKFKGILLSYGVGSFIINGGGDIYVYNENNTSQKFALENPFDNSEMIGTIEIVNESIACSSPSKRSWKDKNSKKINHHLVDFKSGQSSQEKLAVFTQSKSALNADIASTAIFVSPLELSDQIAKKLEVEYLIIFPDGGFTKSKNYKGVLNS